MKIYFEFNLLIEYKIRINNVKTCTILIIVIEVSREANCR